MREFHYIGLVSACIIFSIMNQRLISRRYFRFIPLVFSFGCWLLVLIVFGLLNDVARFNHLWNIVFVILIILTKDYAIVGSAVSIIYLVDTLIIQKLIGKFKGISYAIQGVVGLIFGVNMPILLFYLTEMKLYNWLPNYDPYKNQKEMAVILIIAFVYWQIISARHLLNSKVIDKKKLVLRNIAICTIAIGLGVYIQRFKLVAL